MTLYRKTEKILSTLILTWGIISFGVPCSYGFEEGGRSMLSPKINIGTDALKSSINTLIGLNQHNDNLAGILTQITEAQRKTIETINRCINEKGETYFRARDRNTGKWHEFVIRPLVDVQEAKKLDHALLQEGVKHFSWTENVQMSKAAAEFGKKALIYAVYQLDENGNDLRIVAAGNGFIENPGYKTEKYLHTYNAEVLLSARNKFSGIGTKLFVRRMADTLRKENIQITQGRAFFTAAPDTPMDRSPYTFYVKLGLNPAIGRESAEKDEWFRKKGTDFDLSIEDVTAFLGRKFVGYAPDLKTLMSQELPSQRELNKPNINRQEQAKNKALETFSRIINSKAYMSLQRVFSYDRSVFPYRPVYVGPEKNIQRVEEFLQKAADIFENMLKRFGNSFDLSDRDIIQMNLNDLDDFLLALRSFKGESKSIKAERSLPQKLEQDIARSNQDGIEIPDYIMEMLQKNSDAALIEQTGILSLKDKSNSGFVNLELINSSI